MATLEQQLIELADKHSMTHLGICLYTRSDGTRFFGVSAHDGSFVANNGYSENDSLNAKVEQAIKNLNDLRNEAVVAPVLEALEIAS